ncbi:MAG: glucose-6-phosphate dehydrogenase [Treponema sp.]|nr:glucose-6-phosphate dehydrogenase [Treponema sp.]
MLKTNGDITQLSAAMVIFGGTGDLTHRKLMPALYNLVHNGLLPDTFAVVSVGRREKTTEQYRDEVYESLQKYSRNKIDPALWECLRKLIHYYRFDFTDLSGYGQFHSFLSRIEDEHKTGGSKVFYLAVAPQDFGTIVSGIQAGHLTEGTNAWSRLVIEKPFGKDLVTARQLNEKLHEVFPEKEIFRIDHYLGKEMIQNIMVLRFCNSVFESLWSNKYIDNVQISITEKFGVETRGGYYETSGAMRDMVQNHVIQVLSLVAMEPPVNLSTDSIRTERLKVIQALEEMTPELLRDNVVFGQYGRGYMGGKPVPAYREEEKISPASTVETFVALKLQINNFRWAGTPFYIRTGKRLATSGAQIVIQFKPMPPVLYFKDGAVQEPNLLIIRIQPDMGVFFQFNTKDMQSSRNRIITSKMDTSAQIMSQGNTPEAYERLLHDVLRGDSTLFTRWDAVEASWIFADKIIRHRGQDVARFPNYDAGSMGPVRAFEMLARDGRKWWDIGYEESVK